MQRFNSMIAMALIVLIGASCKNTPNSVQTNMTKKTTDIELSGKVEKITNFQGINKDGYIQMDMKFGMMVDKIPYELVPDSNVRYVDMQGTIFDLDSDAVVLIRGHVDGLGEIEFNGVKAKRFVFKYMALLQKGTGKKEAIVSP